MHVAILGAGNVGGALGKGWALKGHAIAYGVPDPSDAKHRAVAEAAGKARVGTVGEAVRGADAVVLAVPFDAVDQALAAAGDLAGRLVIDVTNPLRMGASGLELSMGFDRSAGEHVAALAPGASVFKTLNQAGIRGDGGCNRLRRQAGHVRRRRRRFAQAGGPGAGRRSRNSSRSTPAD